MSAASERETGAPHLSHFPLPIPSLLPPHSYSHLSPSLLPNTMRISSGRNPSNLITIKPIKSSPRGHPHLISFHLPNARNLRTKSSRFLDYVSDHHPDVVAVTETWFTSRDAAVRAEPSLKFKKKEIALRKRFELFKSCSLSLCDERRTTFSISYNLVI